jgi:demethylmenaquinone methyltransferase/2-methoxy-6-polyprenyl-1,4-benzoquinol methylase
MRFDPEKKDSKKVMDMFSRISPRYDFLNHLFSLNCDKLWRKWAVKNFAPQNGEIYLDLCSGTGDFAVEFKKIQKGDVVCLDFSFDMLKVAKNKRDDLFLVQGDALFVPFKDESFDGAMVGFGIRNLEDLKKGLLEVNRILKKNSKFVILEFPKKVEGIFGLFFNFYFKKVMPFVGRIFSKDEFAYRYLPLSTEYFKSEEELRTLFDECNFEVFSYKKRTSGIVFEAVLIKR